jgi:succinate-semialdehyde dehydrogenase/glutarate-semialdehyde dehydrogenase
MPQQSINPATGETVHEYDELTSQEARKVIRAADRAQRAWRESTFAERARPMRRAAQLLRERSDDLARLMASEMGKLLKDGRSEAEKCAWVCEYYAEHAEQFLASEEVETDARTSLIAYQPLGVIFAIMPWNFPLWQVFRFAAPALMAGNTGVLKHAENVPGCAMAIESIIRDAGFPDDVFRSLLINRKQAGLVIRNPLVRAVTLTGSTAAGKDVAKKSGAVLKKTVLELGGSDPYVVLPDADLEKTVEACVTSRMINAGQSCIAAKRFVVVEALREQFEQLMVERMRRFTMGNPFDDRVTLGPMARRDLRDGLHRQVEQSIAKGAKCLLGGTVPDGNGAFYPPTVLSGVAKGMPAYDEELFGPVAAVIPVQNERQALKVANDSPYGLGAAVFTKDLEKGQRIATEILDAGACFVNAFVKSDPRLPFGGIKESGYGRELSHVGIKEFVNIKTVYVA